MADNGLTCHILPLLLLSASDDISSCFSSILFRSSKPKVFYFDVFWEGKRRNEFVGFATLVSRRLSILLSKLELALVNTGREISCKKEWRYWFWLTCTLLQFKFSCFCIIVIFFATVFCFKRWLAWSATATFLIFLELFLTVLIPLEDTMRVFNWFYFWDDWTILL